MATRYLCSRETSPAGSWGIFGIPLDRTGSFHRGAKDGPNALREASYNLEEYCQIADRSIEDFAFADLGNLDCMDELPLADSLVHLEQEVSAILDSAYRPLMLGGEHTVTLPVVRALASRNPGLSVIHFDAHADLRESYEDEVYSHACVMHHVVELLGGESVFHFGIRSGTRREWQLMTSRRSLLPCTEAGLSEALARIAGRPLYVSVDLDVLDAAVLPGTGTPEPGGLSFLQLDGLLRKLPFRQVVGCDFVELCPRLDQSGISAVTAAKLVRNVLLSSQGQ